MGTPSNMACHNYCISSKAPEGVERLLGLGSKYCVTRPELPEIRDTMKRLRRDTRWKYIFREDPDDDDYIPSLYIRSDKDPDKASDEIEDCLNNFEKALEIERAKRSRKILPNLTPMQQALVTYLEKNEIYKIISLDKNCGLGIINTDHLTERNVSEHLSNSNVYKQLTKRQAENELRGAEMQMQRFMSKHRKNIGKAELTYLRRGLKQRSGKMSRFYTTLKAHKDPYKFRPIVATCGTAIAVLSCWLDYQLQQLKPFISTYIQDSDDLREQMESLGPLPSNARVFTADANSMYTNIDTDHGLEILRQFLEELDEEGKLPPNIKIDIIIEAARIVMRWNIFEYGDCYFRQLVGTAMGTPAAVMWAIIYYYWHEKHCLLPKYGNKIPFLRRFIDDMKGVVLVGGDDGMTRQEWNEFKKDLAFGLLTWEVEEPSLSVNFLDLTIEIKNRAFVTRTYQKPINLYQYIPPSSAHPPEVIRGMIHGMLRRYYNQNSNIDDFWNIAMLFYKRLKERAWDRATLEPIFISAYKKICSQPKKKPNTQSEELSRREQLIVHLEYHRFGIPRKLVRKLYYEHCGELFAKSAQDGGLEIKRLILAYSRPRNLRDLLQRAKLHQQTGREVSTFLGG